MKKIYKRAKRHRRPLRLYRRAWYFKTNTMILHIHAAPLTLMLFSLCLALIFCLVFAAVSWLFGGIPTPKKKPKKRTPGTPEFSDLGIDYQHGAKAWPHNQETEKVKEYISGKTVITYFASNTPSPPWLDTESAKLPVAGGVAFARLQSLEEWNPFYFYEDFSGSIIGVRKMSDRYGQPEHQKFKLADFKYVVRSYGLKTR
ncbi:MAG: hypothetical protein JKY23_06540 [Nitrospinaceae bacterium]|nr:hypothetical protein [Nitrospinaceae bacterium]